MDQISPLGTSEIRFDRRRGRKIRQGSQLGDIFLRLPLQEIIGSARKVRNTKHIALGVFFST